MNKLRALAVVAAAAAVLGTGAPAVAHGADRATPRGTAAYRAPKIGAIGPVKLHAGGLYVDVSVTVTCDKTSAPGNQVEAFLAQTIEGTVYTDGGYSNVFNCTGAPQVEVVTVFAASPGPAWERGLGAVQALYTTFDPATQTVYLAQKTHRVHVS